MKTPQDHVAIKRIELDAKAAAPGPLSRDQRRARTGKGIENDAFAARAIAYRISNHRDGLHGGVKLEIRAAIPEAVDARIGPDIRAVTAVFAEFDVVDVRCVPRLEDSDELVLGTIERPHAGVGLRPDADILQLGVGALTRLKHFADMAPVDALEMDGAINGISR
jgi:hypothetical protein